MQEEYSECSSSALREFCDFFLYFIFALCVCESFFRHAAASAAHFLGPALRPFAPNLLMYSGSQHFGQSCQSNRQVFFVLFTFLLLLRGVEEGFESLLGKLDVMLLLK